VIGPSYVCVWLMHTFEMGEFCNLYMSGGSVLCCHRSSIYNSLTVIITLSQAWSDIVYLL